MDAQFFTFIAIVIIIFLVGREVLCWYWKINRSIALLTEIRDLLAAKGDAQGAMAPVAQQSQTSARPSSEKIDNT